MKTTVMRMTATKKRKKSEKRRGKSAMYLPRSGVKRVKKGGKVEVMINVNAELGVQVTAREVDGKSRVRGTLEKPGKEGLQNSSA